MQNTNNPEKVPEPVGSVAGYFIVILEIPQYPVGNKY